jgi:hypothetical protein
VILPAALLAAQRSGEMPLALTDPTGPLRPGGAGGVVVTATSGEGEGGDEGDGDRRQLRTRGHGIDLLRAGALQR